MKTDTQHLEYLISQYVDGCLDAANKKSLEQRLLNDPSAAIRCTRLSCHAHSCGAM